MSNNAANKNVPFQRVENPLLAKLVKSEALSPKHLRSNNPNLSQASATEKLVDELSLSSYPSHLDIGVTYKGHELIMHLERNDELFNAEYAQLRDSENESEGGMTKLEATPNCFYHGKIDELPKSYISASICHGLSASVITPSGNFAIEPKYVEKLKKIHVTDHSRRLLLADVGASLQHLESEHFTYSIGEDELDSKADSPHYKCGVKHEVATPLYEIPSPLTDAANDGNEEADPERRAYVDSSKPKYIRLLAVNDNKRFKQYGENTEYETTKTVNTIDQFYRNSGFVPPVRLVFVGQVTFNKQDPYEKTTSNGLVDVEGYDGLLSTFNNWRHEAVSDKQIPIHDNGQLFSGETFVDNIVGLSNMYAACDFPRSGGVNQMKYSTTARNAQVAAHEIGHNLGMKHDGDDNKCSTSGNVMASVAGPSELFSECSKQYLRFFFQMEDEQCLSADLDELRKQFEAEIKERRKYEGSDGTILGDEYENKPKPSDAEAPNQPKPSAPFYAEPPEEPKSTPADIKSSSKPEPKPRDIISEGIKNAFTGENEANKPSSETPLEPKAYDVNEDNKQNYHVSAATILSVAPTALHIFIAGTIQFVCGMF